MEAKAAARINALTQASGWEDLKTALEETVEKRWKRLNADMQAGKPVDQRDIDFERGVTHGIRVLLNAPAKAGSIYDRLTKEEPVAE